MGFHYSSSMAPSGNCNRYPGRYLTVDTNYGPGYGNAISWWTSRNRDVETGEGMPYGVQKCDILFDIDREAFWDFYVDILTTNV